MEGPMGWKNPVQWRLCFRIFFWSAFTAALLSAWVFLTEPVVVLEKHGSPAVDSTRLQAHVRALSVTFFPRDSEHIENLDKAAAYIMGEMKAAGASPRLETFMVHGKAYHNVVAEFGPESEQRVVVGAHYDACGEHPGADDNASGVAGLLELAHLLGTSPPPARVELVAFTLEEPPYFGSPFMGSAVHAEASKKAGKKVRAMLCLEMIGRFSDAPGSQHYPSLLLAALYPLRGNFVALVGRHRDVSLVRQVKGAMRRSSAIPVRSITAPP
jgi:Zn-dependent M28 family amino/carboxypeptidase